MSKNNGQVGMRIGGYVAAGFAVFFLILWYVAANVSAGVLYNYLRLKDTAVAVSATVTKVEKVRDSDDNDDTDYRLYVSYTCGETQCRDVFWKTQEKEPVKGFNGMTTTLHVDPEEPTLQRPSAFAAWGSAGFVTLIMLAAGTLSVDIVTSHWVEMAKRLEWSSIYAAEELDVFIVQTELDHEADKRSRYVLFVGAFLLAAMAAAIATQLHQRHLPIFACLCAAGNVGMLMVLRLIIGHARQGNIVTELRTVTRSGIVRVSDGDGGTLSKWELDGFGQWHASKSLFVSVRGTEWADTASITTYHIALNDRKRILRIYPADEFRIRSM